MKSKTDTHIDTRAQNNNNNNNNGLYVANSENPDPNRLQVLSFSIPF